MPKISTLEIQNSLVKLGTQLGFDSRMEERIHSRDLYSPIYDVVWYLDLTKHFDMYALMPLFKNDMQLFNRMKMLPFAGFEIEGSDTTSKNQIGNFANLYAGRFIYKFEIVNNNATKWDDDTYRRGVKIYRYCKELFGEKNSMFIDSTHLMNSINEYSNENQTISFNAAQSKYIRSTYGGEKEKNQKMFNTILPMLVDSGLIIKQNQNQEICNVRYKRLRECFSKSISENGKYLISQRYNFDPTGKIVKESKQTRDSFYVPKLDVELGFDAPMSFLKWLKVLSDQVGRDSVHSIILYGLNNNNINNYFISLIGLELETSINKHLNGGICNLSNYCYTGVLVTQEDASNHVDFFRNELGLRNITYFKVDEK